MHISDKPGTCPAPPSDQSDCPFPTDECSVDHDCDENMKCCDRLCGRVCVEPEFKGKIDAKIPRMKNCLLKSNLSFVQPR